VLVSFPFTSRESLPAQSAPSPRVEGREQCEPLSLTGCDFFRICGDPSPPIIVTLIAPHLDFMFVAVSVPRTVPSFPPFFFAVRLAIILPEGFFFFFFFFFLCRFFFSYFSCSKPCPLNHFWSIGFSCFREFCVPLV